MQNRKTIVAEKAVMLGGKVTGLGVDPLDPKTGNFSNNLPLPGAQLEVFATHPTTGAREGAALLRVERPQHVFARQCVKLCRIVVVRFESHPMHSRKALRLRLIQAFTVPNGVAIFSAISAWV